MLGGPKLTDCQVLDRITDIFQTYDSSGGLGRYRTAILFEQKQPLLQLDNFTPPILVWRIAADSKEGSTYDVVGFHDRSDAVSECVEWVGEDRRVGLDLMSGSALTVLMTSIQRIMWK